MTTVTRHPGPAQPSSPGRWTAGRPWPLARRHLSAPSRQAGSPVSWPSSTHSLTRPLSTPHSHNTPPHTTHSPIAHRTPHILTFLRPPSPSPMSRPLAGPSPLGGPSPRPGPSPRTGPSPLGGPSPRPISGPSPRPAPSPRAGAGAGAAPSPVASSGAAAVAQRNLSTPTRPSPASLTGPSPQGSSPSALKRGAGPADKQRDPKKPKLAPGPAWIVDKVDVMQQQYKVCSRMAWIVAP